MKHHSFRYNSFIFKKSGPDHPALQSMEKEMKKETQKASEAMKGTPHKAGEVAAEAKKKVAKIVESTVDKMGWKTDADLNKPENEPFMLRLAEIQMKATETIDANFAKYEKHVEAAKLMVTLKTNYEAFKKLENNRDLSTVSTLMNVADALDGQRDLVKNYAPKEHKAFMLTDLEDQVIKFRAKAQEIAEYQIQKLNKQDEALAELEKQAEAQDPKLSAAKIRELWKFAGKINTVVKSFADVPQLADFAAKAQQKFNDYWGRIQKVHALNVARSPELKAADEDLLKAETDLNAAQQHVDSLEKNPKSTAAEKAKAQQALEKAKGNFDEKRNYFSRLALIIDEGDLKWGSSPSAEMIAVAKQQERPLKGKNRLAVNTAIEGVEDANTVEDTKRAMIRLGTLIAEHGLDDLSIRRRLQDLGFRLPKLGADAKEFRLVYYHPETGDRFERSVKPLSKPVELEEKMADVRKRGIPVLNDLDTRPPGSTLALTVDGIRVKITKLAHREYKIGGKVISAVQDETPVYKRVMTVALRKKRIRAARAVPGVRYVKAEKPTDQKAA